jgi:RNA polymerase sigma factor (sigma-70 family)
MTQATARPARPTAITALLEDLVRQHQRMIHSLCYRMTGSMADAQDLAQETFLSAYRHLHAFRGEAALSSWLHRIAVNHCLNWLSRGRKQRELQQKWSAAARFVRTCECVEILQRSADWQSAIQQVGNLRYECGSWLKGPPFCPLKDQAKTV